MAFSFTWSATFKSLPADTEAASQGASRIRDLKNAITERMQVDHSWTGTVSDGKHLQVTLPVRASDPTTVASTGYAYTKTVSAKAELFYKDSSGSVIQITSGGLINVVNSAVATAATAATARSLTGTTTVASAATPDIFALANGAIIDYTGTVACTGFVAAPAGGMTKVLYCADAAPFTASANLLIEGHESGSTVTLAAGAVVTVFSRTTTQFKLSYTLSGTFTATGTGFTVAPTGTALYTYSNGFITISLPRLTGTSNTAGFTITGKPSNLRANEATGAGIFLVIGSGADNGTTTHVQIKPLTASDAINLAPFPTATWTTSGTKTLEATTITYRGGT